MGKFIGYAAVIAFAVGVLQVTIPVFQAAAAQLEMATRVPPAGI